MDIDIVLRKRKYNISSDRYNFILRRYDGKGNIVFSHFYTFLPNLLGDLFQEGIKDAKHVDNFRELIKVEKELMKEIKECLPMIRSAMLADTGSKLLEKSKTETKSSVQDAEARMSEQ